MRKIHKQDFTEFAKMFDLKVSINKSTIEANVKVIMRGYMVLSEVLKSFPQVSPNGFLRCSTHVSHLLDLPQGQETMDLYIILFIQLLLATIERILLRLFLINEYHKYLPILTLLFL